MDAVIKVDKDSIDKIIKSDEEINKFRSKIDTQIMNLLVKRAPMAIDLRETISSLKISQDLERAGDHVTNIAETICYLIKGEYLKGSRPKGKQAQE